MIFENLGTSIKDNAAGLEAAAPAHDQELTAHRERSNAAVTTIKLEQFLRCPISTAFGLKIDDTQFKEDICRSEDKESKDSIAKLSEDEPCGIASNAAAFPHDKFCSQSESHKNCPAKGVPRCALQYSQDAQQFEFQHSCVQQVQFGSPSCESPSKLQPCNEMNNLLAQYHQIWSSFDKHEAEIRNASEPNSSSDDNIAISLSELFSQEAISSKIEKVSLDLLACTVMPNDESETYEKATSVDERSISNCLINSYQSNQAPQVQLCHVRAHLAASKKPQQSGSIFDDLRGAMHSEGVIGRPHAHSLKQCKPKSSVKSSSSKGMSISTMNSPQLQPTVSAPPSQDFDVRSLLYCSSDSDEIQSLVNQAADYWEEEDNGEPEELRDLNNSNDDESLSQDNWSTSHSQHLATAFECNISLLHLDSLPTKKTGASQPPKTIHYNNLMSLKAVSFE